MSLPAHPNFLTPVLERPCDRPVRSCELRAALEEPFDSPHGFRSFSLRDPGGNIWDIAWKDGSAVNAAGDLTWN